MFYLILGIHLALCAGIIFLVLLQQGKGADMGAAFGGGSNTLFGAGGATALITKITTGMAVAFFVTSILLVKGFGGGANHAVVATDPAAGSVMAGVPQAQSEAAPATAPNTEGAKVAGEVPVVPAPVAAAPEPKQEGATPQ